MEKDEIKAAMSKDLKNLAEEYFESAYKPDALLAKEDAKDVLDLAERLIKIASEKIIIDK